MFTMTFLKLTFLFIKSNLKKLQRKWISLPLLLLFPILIITMIAVIFIMLFTPSETNPIKVGIVNYDESQETKMVIELLESTSQFGEIIQVSAMDENKAKKYIDDNMLSAYIIFKKNFTNDLYTGNSVEIPIVGNPKEPIKSLLVEELFNSIARHIAASQANILTINYYASELGMDENERQTLLFEQFKEFLFYTLGKDQILKEEELENIATTSPIQYYGLAGWFIITTAWLLLFYIFFHQEDKFKIKQRMKLYGVTELQQIIAKIVVSFVITFILISITFVGLILILDSEFMLSDYIKVLAIMTLYSILFLTGLALIEVIIPSQKLSLLIQSIMTIFLLLLSGAFVPTIYFPITVQEISNYLFSNQAFYWLTEILIHERFYIDYIPLLFMTIAGLFVLIGISRWKERTNS